MAELDLGIVTEIPQEHRVIGLSRLNGEDLGVGVEEAEPEGLATDIGAAVEDATDRGLRRRDDLEAGHEEVTEDPRVIPSTKPKRA